MSVLKKAPSRIWNTKIQTKCQTKLSLLQEYFVVAVDFYNTIDDFHFAFFFFVFFHFGVYFNIQGPILDNLYLPVSFHMEICKKKIPSHIHTYILWKVWVCESTLKNYFSKINSVK